MTLFGANGLLVACSLIYLVAFAYASWRDPRYGIMLIAATLPSYLLRLNILGIPTTVLELSIAVLFTVWLIRDSRWRRIHLALWRKERVENMIPRPFRFPLALFLVAAFLAALVSANQPAAWGIFKAYFIDAYLLLIVAAYEIRSARDVEKLFMALGVLTLAIGAYAVIQYVTGNGIPNPFWADPAHRRVTTLFGYPNANGLLVAPIVAFYILWVSKKSSPAEITFKLLVIVAGLAAIVTAKTTGALIALAATLWIGAFRSGKNRSSLLAVTLFAVLAIFLMTPVSEKIQRTAVNVQANYLDLSSSSLEIRINQWRETVALLADHPFAGAGLAGYQKALIPYHRYDFLEIYLYPHSSILNFWVELGILGLLAAISLAWRVSVTLRDALDARLTTPDGKILSRAILFAWLTLLIHGLVDVPYFKNDLSILCILLLAVTFFIDRTTADLHRKYSFRA